MRAMTYIQGFSDLKLLTHCPVDDACQLLHKVLDGKCGRAPPLYTAFSKIWSLEEWWQLLDSCQALSNAYFSNGWTENQLSEQLSDLSAEYRQVVVKVLTSRVEDVRLAMVDSVNGISHASLVDFDWRAKVAVSSDKMASVWQPLVSVDLSLNSCGDKKLATMELDRDELKKLITSLEAADRVVTQLTT